MYNIGSYFIQRNFRRVKRKGKKKKIKKNINEKKYISFPKYVDGKFNKAFNVNSKPSRLGRKSITVKNSNKNLNDYKFKSRIKSIEKKESVKGIIKAEHAVRKYNKSQILPNKFNIVNGEVCKRLGFTRMYYDKVFDSSNNYFKFVLRSNFFDNKTRRNKRNFVIRQRKNLTSIIFKGFFSKVFKIIRLNNSNYYNIISNIFNIFCRGKFNRFSRIKKRVNKNMYNIKSLLYLSNYHYDNYGLFFSNKYNRFFVQLKDSYKNRKKVKQVFWDLKEFIGIAKRNFIHILRDFFYIFHYFFYGFIINFFFYYFKFFMYNFDVNIFYANYTVYKRKKFTIKNLTNIIKSRIYKYFQVRPQSIVQFVFYYIANNYPYFSGIRLRFSGRFTKKQRAFSLIKQFGRVPLSTCQFPVEYWYTTNVLKYGSTNIKVQLSYKFKSKFFQKINKQANFIFRNKKDYFISFNNNFFNAQRNNYRFLGTKRLK